METDGRRELERIVTSGQISDKDRLAETLTALCLAPGRRPDPREMSLFFDIVRGIIRDIEIHVRQNLADGLAKRADAPHDLIVMLANDVFDVAEPVLLRSPILDDADLIALIHQRTTRFRLAISRRETLTENVSEAFVDTRDTKALKSLLQNKGALFNDESLSRLVDESLVTEEYQELLLSRRDLPASLAYRMYEWVSDALQQQISTMFPVSDMEIEEAVSQALKRAISSNARPASEAEKPQEWTGRPSPESLRRALELQDILKFEDMFQELTGLDSATTTRTLYDMGPEGLAVACRAAGLDADTFSEILCHVQGTRPFGIFRQSPAFSRGMNLFKRTDRSNARKIVEGWGGAPNSGGY
ncbi:MAG: DUF2336 domain-containing protein [Alphaproteobacteria bacterium]